MTLRMFPLAICISMLVASAMAADKPKDATRRLQQQLRKAEQDKSQLIREKTDIEGRLKEAEQKLSTAEGRADAVTRRVAQLGKELKAAKAENESFVAAAELLNRKIADIEQRALEQKRAFEAEKARFESVSRQQLISLQGCTERNAKMYKLGNELLEKYEHKRCWDSALQTEPFTGLRRVRIENMIEEDREQLDKNQLLPVERLSEAKPESP